MNKPTPRTKLKNIRKERKLTQREVADYIGTGRNHYASIERGERKPGTDLAIRISDFFGINIKELR